MTLLDFSLFTRSQNADTTCEVPELSNISMQACLCGRVAQFRWFAQLAAKCIHFATYLYSASKALRLQEGMAANSVTALGLVFIKPTVHTDVGSVKPIQ